MAVGWIMGAWYHLKLTELDRNYMYATITVWCFDRLMRIVRIIYSGVKSNADVRFHEGDVVTLKMNYSNRWKHYPGCFVFIYILRPNRFWESHPFTVMVPPKPVESNKLQITFKVKNGLTKHTKDFLFSSCGEELSANIPILIEGPYGRYHNLHLYDSVVLIAGGIGVTSTYSYAYDLIKNCSNEKQRITFIWYMHDRTPLDWFSEELDLLRSDSRVTVRIFVKYKELASASRYVDDSNSGLGEKYFTVVSQEITATSSDKTEVATLVSEAVSRGDPRIAFLSCGPGRMNDDIRFTISKSLSSSKSRVDYFEESFSW
ncbi:Fre5p [Sugiyamaella lignohabitans]|uniref:Fre5p n=1 Tax=Sugiyamaella lignohabitans TaxID=796027 RepID=A0A161HH90_9ASCO|nr:Fre5p [Sugiyamaella lignohabitans]ANB15310.1 Fre5p [Sugiyamaella lignohabitans]